MSDRGLTHLDPLGRARMVDVTPKEATHRRAISRCKVFMKSETTAKVASNAITKGDVLGAARIAGIQAAKRTADMIPLCHPLLVGAVTINFTLGDDFVEVETQVGDRRPHRRGDGGHDRLRGRRPDHLRHVQIDRPFDGHRRPGPVGEDRGPQRPLAAAGRIWPPR